MTELKITVEENIDIGKAKVYNGFGDENWGPEHHPDPVENKLNFFREARWWISGYINGQLVGLIKVHDRSFIFNKKSVKMGGIAGVVSHKDFRRQGIIKKLLKYTYEKVLKDNKYDIAMLCTNIEKLGKLYGTIGFVPLGRPYYFLDINGKEKLETDGMIAPVESVEIFKDILESDIKIEVGKSNF